MLQQTHVIVGASLAGASAAAALRKEGFEGRIILIGEEHHRPYERPELTKKYLRGEVAADELYVHDPGLYAEERIELRLGQRVERIHPGDREVVVDGEPLTFDRLLLATGAEPRALLIPGAGLDGVLAMRTVEDADRVRERAATADSIVVAGGGWIGSEVAASLRQLGRPVTLVLPEQVPLERVLGPEVGGAFLAAHERHGVRVVAGRRISAVEGRDRVSGVRLDDGSSIKADLVVVGIGARPRDDLAANAGIAHANGVLVDEHLQTSASGIFAAGDVASAFHPRYGQHIRVEHWDNAKRQGRAAASAMLGRGEPYARTPYFYSDQYELGMEYVGYAPSWDRVVFRGDPRDPAFLAFWLKGGLVVAAMHVNTWDATADLRKLVDAERPIDPGRLSDPERPLGHLLPDLAAA
jgi:3-phenylpropionate/trans-cinnamate dioxygenase ferredoxin reductase subunit